MMRRRIWIDQKVQGGLVNRAVIYWLSLVAYFAVGHVVFQFIDQPEWTYEEHFNALLGAFGFWFPGIVLMTPLIVFDIVKTSHRFAGPIYRMRNYLHKVGTGEEKGKLWFREGDYWWELVEPVNVVVTRMLTAEESAAELKKKVAVLEREKMQLQKQLQGDTSSQVASKPIATPVITGGIATTTTSSVVT
jgi:hypothetical protein